MLLLLLLCMLLLLLFAVVSAVVINIAAVFFVSEWPFAGSRQPTSAFGEGPTEGPKGPDGSTEGPDAPLPQRRPLARAAYGP